MKGTIETKEATRSVRFSMEDNKAIDEMLEQTGLSFSAFVRKCIFQGEDKGDTSVKMLMPLGELSTAINILKYKNEDGELKPYIATIERSTERLWRIL